jgi:hypothetical protein
VLARSGLTAGHVVGRGAALLLAPARVLHRRQLGSLDQTAARRRRQPRRRSGGLKWDPPPDTFGIGAGRSDGVRQGTNIGRPLSAGYLSRWLGGCVTGWCGASSLCDEDASAGSLGARWADRSRRAVSGGVRASAPRDDAGAFGLVCLCPSCENHDRRVAALDWGRGLRPRGHGLWPPARAWPSGQFDRCACPDRDHTLGLDGWGAGHDHSREGSRNARWQATGVRYLAAPDGLCHGGSERWLRAVGVLETAVSDLSGAVHVEARRSSDPQAIRRCRWQPGPV